jgi:hypothetical protein
MVYWVGPMAWPKGPSRLGLTQPDPHSLAHLSLTHARTRSPPTSSPARPPRPRGGAARPQPLLANPGTGVMGLLLSSTNSTTSPRLIWPL